MGIMEGWEFEIAKGNTKKYFLVPLLSAGYSMQDLGG
jgi:hypothetical protein